MAQQLTAAQQLAASTPLLFRPPTFSMLEAQGKTLLSQPEINSPATSVKGTFRSAILEVLTTPVSIWEAIGGKLGLPSSCRIPEMFLVR